MYTTEHFALKKEHKTTIRRIIDRYIEGIPMAHSSGAGRPARKITPRKFATLKDLFDHKCGVSQRIVARKCNISQPYVNKILKTKTAIKCYKKIKIPKRTEKQKDEGRTKCATLFRTTKNVAIVMDDETYCTLSHSTINGNDNFYSSNIEMTPSEVKFKTKAKFEKKALVYLVASERGISKAFVTPSGQAINQEVYKNQCIKRRLIPFLKKYHSDGDYQFWPDLASSHYADSVLDYFTEHNINFVQKYENPANLPEVRPIEDFWAILKQKIYANGWEASNIDELIKRIRLCIRRIDPSTIQRLFF